MAKALFWLSLTYAGLKFASIVLARSPGFRRAEISLGDRLRMGEPGLFLAALVLAVPAALGTDWYAEHTLRRIFGNAIGCYGQILALKDAPEVKAMADNFTVYERVQGYKEIAFTTGANLGIERNDVDAALANEVKTTAERHVALRTGNSANMTMTEWDGADRCIYPPSASPAV